VLDAESIKKLRSSGAATRTSTVTAFHAARSSPACRLLHARLGHNERSQYASARRLPAQRRSPGAEHETAKARAGAGRRGRGAVGIIAYGTSHWAVIESRVQLEAEGVKTAYMRIRAYPFPAEVDAFLARYPRIYLVEQNRDAQLRMLLRNDLPPAAW
jgi:2-oxoglutarate ferredoxin oxidoreductase subunit alpha